jgi:hypothetical protein
MLERVISGGQTGVDQAAILAARVANIPTGGWAPLGWLTESGPAPWLGEYGLKEMRTASYRARTEQNVRDSTATLWFGSTSTPEAKTTLLAIRGMGRPHMLVIPGQGVRPSDVAAWITAGGFKVLNVAGNRESKSPGIGDRVAVFLGRVFDQLARE